MISLGDTRKNHFARIASGGLNSAQFSLGDDIESGTQFPEKSNDGKIRICFNGKAHQMLIGLQRLLIALKSIDDGLFGINV